jgi:hypothetical protein
MFLENHHLYHLIEHYLLVLLGFNLGRNGNLQEAEEA